MSFHETKNIMSGEGGALLINDPSFYERAEIIREKGTNRSLFFKGKVDKYTWVDIGSSYLPSDLIAAFLLPQMEEAEDIIRRRSNIWSIYDQSFSFLEKPGLLRRPVIPPNVKHNSHMYYLLLPDLKRRNYFIEYMKEKGIQTVFHYVPLHNSPAGMKFGRSIGDLPVTCEMSERLVRLPLWLGLEESIYYVIQHVLAAVEGAAFCNSENILLNQK
jgi:dTDP-4-amino-4,6-dideoxygalactose transaminase